MKTVTVTAAQPELRKLVEEAFRGAPVVLAYGEKRVKLERYAPISGAAGFDLEQDSAELEEELLKAVRGPFTPYDNTTLDLVRVMHGARDLPRRLRLLDPPPEPEPPRRQISFHARPDDKAVGVVKGR